MKNKNIKLQATLDSLGLGNDPAKALAKQEADKQKAIADLKQLKELLDAKIITQEEFDTRKKKLLEKL
jgi:multidrug resistance efflux pump